MIAHRENFGYSIPVRFQLGLFKIYFVSEADQIATILRTSHGLSSKPGILIALKNILGTPKHVIPFYAADDSGVGRHPQPGSSVSPEHRISYFQHKAAHKYLTGRQLVSINERYMSILQRNISNGNIGYDWVEVPDLYAFLQVEVFRAAVESMFGTWILSLNPTLVKDFWEFDRNVPLLYKGVPRWLCPSAYKARDRLISGIKEWHKFAHEHSDCTKVGPEDPDWDPYWGCKLLKARQEYCLQMGVMDADAIAAEDLGLLFAYVFLSFEPTIH